MPKPTPGQVDWADDLNNYLDDISPASEGDIIIGGTAGAPTKLPVGTQGQTLRRKSNGRPGYVDEFINVKAEGAAGDGTTDDTTVLQGLIDTLSAAGGGILYFPKGTYRANLVLKSGITLTSMRGNYGYVGGTSYAPTRIQGVTTGPVIDTPNGSACQNAAIQGIDIVGVSAATATVGIRFRDANWCAIKQVHISGCLDQGLLVDSTSLACVFEDMLVFNCLLDTTRAAAAGAMDIDGTDHYISRIEATASLIGQTDANMYCVAVYLKGSNHSVTQVIAEISDRGWLISASRCRFAACRGDLNFGHDWEITGGSNAFAACAAISGGRAMTNTYDGFKVSGIGNVFAACTTGQAGADRYKWGFEDTGASGTYGNYNQYVACMPNGWTTAGWSTTGALGAAVVTGNRPARPSLGGTNPTTWDVTGIGVVLGADYTAATTVTAFTGGVSGQELTVIGDADLTIANNATIKTNTGANLTLAANRAYKFVNYNAVWYQV